MVSSKTSYGEKVKKEENNDAKDKNEKELLVESSIVESNSSSDRSKSSNYGSTVREEEEIEAEEDSSLPYPNRSTMHMVFIVLNVVTIASLSCLGFGQILPIGKAGIFSWTKDLLRLDFFFLIVIVCIPIELNVSYFVTDSLPILTNWISKGFLFCFVGLIGMEEGLETSKSNYNSDYYEERRHIMDWENFFPKLGTQLSAIFVWASSLVLALCGLLYFMFGILCLERLKKRYEREYDEIMSEFHERSPA